MPKYNKTTNPLNIEGRIGLDNKKAVIIKENSAEIMKNTKSKALCVNARNIKLIIRAFNAINMRACPISILT